MKVDFDEKVEYGCTAVLLNAWFWGTWGPVLKGTDSTLLEFKKNKINFHIFLQIHLQLWNL